MRDATVRLTLGTALSLLATTQCLGAEIYVREARGSDLTPTQSYEITKMVEASVGEMLEHNLVASETLADFILQPLLLTRDNEIFLRIEKEKDGLIISSAEERVDSVAFSNRLALEVTELAMDGDSVPDENNEDQVDQIGRDESAYLAPSGRHQDHHSSRGDSASSTQLPFSRGKINAPSPRFSNPERRGFFTIGLGPAFGGGLQTDNILLSLNMSYNRNATDRLTAKMLADLNIGTGSESARFLNFAIGSDFYPLAGREFNGGLPYLSADLGFAFTQDSEGLTKDAPAIGAGAGFKFTASELNLDLNRHYSILTTDIDGENPSLLGLRAAVSF
jgi:hypothetical protein